VFWRLPFFCQELDESCLVGGTTESLFPLLGAVPRLNVLEIDPCPCASVALFYILNGFLLVDIKENINAPALSNIMDSLTNHCTR
jgi:hypothetical protein